MAGRPVSLVGTDHPSEDRQNLCPDYGDLIPLFQELETRLRTLLERSAVNESHKSTGAEYATRGEQVKGRHQPNQAEQPEQPEQRQQFAQSNCTSPSILIPNPNHSSNLTQYRSVVSSGDGPELNNSVNVSSPLSEFATVTARPCFVRLYQYTHGQVRRTHAYWYFERRTPLREIVTVLYRGVVTHTSTPGASVLRFRYHRTSLVLTLITTLQLDTPTAAARNTDDLYFTGTTTIPEHRDI